MQQPEQEGGQDNRSRHRAAPKQPAQDEAAEKQLLGQRGHQDEGKERATRPVSGETRKHLGKEGRRRQQGADKVVKLGSDNQHSRLAHDDGGPDRERDGAQREEIIPGRPCFPAPPAQHQTDRQQVDRAQAPRALDQARVHHKAQHPQWDRERNLQCQHDRHQQQSVSEVWIGRVPIHRINQVEIGPTLAHLPPLFQENFLRNWPFSIRPSRSGVRQGARLPLGIIGL